MDSSISQTSKLDMSLDDIIKLDRKQSRGRGRSIRGVATGQRRAAVNASRVRVLAKKNRLNVPTANRRGRGKIVMSRINYRGRPINRGKQPASAALAVLRRARKTAAAAVRAARDAASILQRSRQQRQRVFDARRLSLPNTSTAFRDQRGRGMGRQKGPTRRHSFPIQAQANVMRRMRSYQAPAMNQQLASRAARRSNIDQASNRARTYQLQSIRAGGFRQRRDVYNIQPQQRFGSRNVNDSRSSLRGRPINRSRNAEYLAQARALIRAQNEQSRNGNFVVRGQTLPKSAGRSRRHWFV